MSANESSEVVNRPAPGAQLRQAREQAGISLQVVAERTLITLTKLQALERGDFSDVGGTAHVTGYARAYARVIGLDPKDLIDDIQKALGEEQTRADAVQRQTREGARQNTAWIYPAVVVLLLILLAAWAVMWMFSSEIEGGERDQGSTEAPAAAGAEHRLVLGDEERSTDREYDLAPVVADAEVIVAESSAAADAAPVSESVGSITPPGTEAMEQSASVATPAAQDGLPLNSAGSDSVGEAAIAQTPAASPGSSSTSVPVEWPSEANNVASENAVDVPRDHLQLSFVEDCWLEISDASGKTIIADMAMAGETREITGDAPFRVLLGDASAASSIVYNQENVSFSPRPGQRILRLTIGE